MFQSLHGRMILTQGILISSLVPPVAHLLQLLIAKHLERELQPILAPFSHYDRNLAVQRH